MNLKNAWGPGVFLGGEYRLDEKWSLSATLGHLRLKTEGTVSTQTDPRLLAASLVPAQAAADIGPMTSTAIRFVNGTLTGGSGAVDDPTNQLPAVLRELARARTGDPNNLGTYVRKVKATLNPWLLTVALGRDILGKPDDAAHALDMLQRLSGQTHRVLTCVAVGTARRQQQMLQVSKVRMGEIPIARLRAYVRGGEPMGKAGAYAIQGQAAGFIEHISGSHSGIMGLPLFETAALLRDFGFKV